MKAKKPKSIAEQLNILELGVMHVLVMHVLVSYMHQSRFICLHKSNMLLNPSVLVHLLSKYLNSFALSSKKFFYFNISFLFLLNHILHDFHGTTALPLTQLQFYAKLVYKILLRSKIHSVIWFDVLIYTPQYLHLWLKYCCFVPIVQSCLY